MAAKKHNNHIKSKIIYTCERIECYVQNWKHFRFVVADCWQHSRQSTSRAEILRSSQIVWKLDMKLPLLKILEFSYIQHNVGYDEESLHAKSSGTGFSNQKKYQSFINFGLLNYQ